MEMCPLTRPSDKGSRPGSKPREVVPFAPLLLRVCVPNGIRNRTTVNTRFYCLSAYSPDHGDRSSSGLDVIFFHDDPCDVCDNGP